MKQRLKIQVLNLYDSHEKSTGLCSFCTIAFVLHEILLLQNVSYYLLP